MVPSSFFLHYINTVFCALVSLSGGNGYPIHWLTSGGSGRAATTWNAAHGLLDQARQLCK